MTTDFRSLIPNLPARGKIFPFRVAGNMRGLQRFGWVFRGSAAAPFGNFPGDRE